MLGNMKDWLIKHTQAGREGTREGRDRERDFLRGPCFSHSAISGQFVWMTAAVHYRSVYFADSLWRMFSFMRSGA